MKIKKYLTLLAALFALAACDDQATNTTEVVQNMGMPTVQEGDSLGVCNDSTVASIVFVADSGKVLFCDGHDWRNLDGIDGKDGEDGRDGKDGVDGKPGVNGYNGSNCSATLDSNMVYKIACGSDSIEIDLKIRTPSACSVDMAGDSSVVLVCGADSAMVHIGEMGPAGEPCSETDNGDGTYTRKCGDSEILFYKGLCGDTPYDPEEYTCDGLDLVKRGE